jgi:hypothetical protein
MWVALTPVILVSQAGHLRHPSRWKARRLLLGSALLFGGAAALEFAAWKWRASFLADVADSWVIIGTVALVVAAVAMVRTRYESKP